MEWRLPPLGGVRTMRPAVVLRRAAFYWPWAMSVFLATLIVGLAIIFLVPAPFKSEARLLALPGDYYSVRDDPDRVTGNENLRPEDVMNVEMQLLSSRDLKREALKRSGAAVQPGLATERAIDDVERDLRVLPVAQASVIELSFSADEAQEAQDMLATILESYFAMRADVFTSGRLELLTSQRDAARRDLQTANEALSEFQRANNVANVQEQITGAVEINTALRRDLADARALLSGSQGALGRERVAVSRLPRTVEIFRDNTEATRARSDIQAKIVALEAERADLAQRYMEGSALIEKVDTQIAGLRRSLARATEELPEARRMGPSAAYDEASRRVRESEASVSGIASRIAQLEQEIVQSETRLQRLNALAADIANLEVQREVTENRFRALAAQVEAARSRAVEAGTGSANVRIIQQPTLPSARVRSPAMLLMATVLIALILSVATAFLLATIRDVPVDAEDAAQSFGVPILVDLGNESSHDALPAPDMVRAADEAGTGRVIGVVGATREEYARSLYALVRLFAEEGTTAVVTFEPAAYQGALKSREGPRQVAQNPDRYLIGSRAWLEGRAGSELLRVLRAKHRWIILFVPPATGTIGEQLQLAAVAEADENLVLVNTGVTEEQSTRSLLDRLEVLARPMRGLVIVGRKLTLSSVMSPLFGQRKADT
jgi:uncharacterized protein involved in exopolysaccharide biosynthesis